MPHDLPCYYFEATLGAMPGKEAICMVAIGLKRNLGAAGAASFRSNTLPGWDAGSFGYVSDGLLYDGGREPSADTRRVAKGAPRAPALGALCSRLTREATAGDTFGVGVFTAARQVFFTCVHLRSPSSPVICRSCLV